MAAPPISIKLRCASWRQVAAIYERDLLRDALFLKSAAPPPVGTTVHITLTLPTQTLIVLGGAIAAHVPPGGMNGRGPGVDIRLSNVPHSALWLIESALASARKNGSLAPRAPQPTAPAGDARAGEIRAGEIRAGEVRAGEVRAKSNRPASEHDIEANSELVAAESDLLRALTEELRVFRKLNPFQLLNIGYDADDHQVRAAFAKLTKRFHPDRYMRYQSTEVYRTASEIFILVRNAYQHLDTAAKRTRTHDVLNRRRAALGTPAESYDGDPTIKIPSQRPHRPAATAPARARPARPDTNRPAPAPAAPPTPAPSETSDARAPAVAPSAPTGTPTEQAFALLDAGDHRKARELFRLVTRRNKSNRDARIGLELSEGLIALDERDRLEAAQRFEVVLELDPNNERAAQMLAEMRKKATAERKNHMARLLNRKGSV